MKRIALALVPFAMLVSLFTASPAQAWWPGECLFGGCWGGGGYAGPYYGSYYGGNFGPGYLGQPYPGPYGCDAPYNNCPPPVGPVCGPCPQP